MSVISEIQGRGGIWRSAPAASVVALSELRLAAPVVLPESYFEFLRFSNGGEGDLGVEPGWFAPWPAEDVIRNNLGYGVARSVPWLFGFGSNGGGEMFGFDCRSASEIQIVMVPFIGMDSESVATVAANFEQFLSLCGLQAPRNDR
jgi:SMI1-KNR4 cell-wall